MKQQLEALKLANASRKRGARIIHRIERGWLSPIAALKDKDHALQVYRILLAIPGIGETKAKRVLMAAKVGRHVRSRDLTDRQLTAVVAGMREVAGPKALRAIERRGPLPPAHTHVPRLSVADLSTTTETTRT